ncbi:MAG TPA: hypothetical protein VHW00_04480 [Thermoanaerobaculia bacterium]|nr:hypothetical protein [Thermoanaerobaculia bacterium]
MDRTRTRGWLAETGGWTRGVHARGISAKQRLHLAIVLIVALFAFPSFAQSADEHDIQFDLTITEEEFAKFSRLVAQGIYASPIEPARARGILGFDVGVGATAIPVDTNASYWQKSVGDDFTVSDYVGVPRVIVSKGLSAVTVSASYAKVPDTDIQVWGGALDVPIINGGIVKPTLALRGSYAQLKGVDEFELTTYGVEVFLSKGFGPLTPYAAVGRARSDATGHIVGVITAVPIPPLHDEADSTRITVGLKFSLLIPKIVVEATQAEERSYSAKISFGL